MTELPTGWSVAMVSELIGAEGLFVDGDWVESKDQDSSGEIRLTQLADVGDGEWRDRSDRHMTAEAAERLHCTELEVGDVLVARMPDPLGRACRFPGDAMRCVTVVDVAVIRPGPRGVNADWLMWSINSPLVRTRIEALQAGTTRKRISRKNLGGIEIAVPPVAEQERIVAAIEEAFSKIGAGEDSLQTIRQRLKRMRDAVLAAAFHGLDFSTECVALCDEIVDCPHSTAAFLPEGRPCVDTTCIEPGRVVLDRLRYVSDDTWQERVRRLEPAEGDVVFAREGTIGTAVALPGGLNPCLGQRVMLLRPGASVLPRFLEQVMMSQQVKEQYAPLVAGSTAPHLNVRDVKRLLLPAPPHSEQVRMLAEVDRQVSFIEACERTVNAGLAQSTALRRSVLKAAFEGTLVAQIPSDEPAALLLERIRNEREASEPAPSRRRKAEAS